MSDANLTLADLAERQARTAARLAACLAEFPDDPTCCAEYISENDEATEALDRALYPEAEIPPDELEASVQRGMVIFRRVQDALAYRDLCKALESLAALWTVALASLDDDTVLWRGMGVTGTRVALTVEMIRAPLHVVAMNRAGAADGAGE